MTCCTSVFNWSNYLSTRLPTNSEISACFRLLLNSGWSSLNCSTTTFSCKYASDSASRSTQIALDPAENWQRIRVLRNLTGLETDVPREAGVLSKDTVLLLDMLYESRHRSTHPGDKGPEEELVYTVLFCCVQLCVRLETEIQEGKKRRWKMIIQIKPSHWQ